MSDLVPISDTLRNELAEFSTADLRAELARGLTLTAQTLMRLGTIWAELERRGEDLSELRHGLARVLPLIASGLLAAEAVAAFAGRSSIMRALEGLPLPEQRRIAEGGTVEVATSVNSQRTELVPITSIPAGQLRVVFHDGAILPPAEQRVRLGRKRRVSRDQEEEEQRRYRPHYDPEKGTVQVGKMVVQLADLLDELTSGIDYPPMDGDEALTVKTRLHRHELDQLLAISRKASLPEWELIRKALRAFGLI